MTKLEKNSNTYTLIAVLHSTFDGRPLAEMICRLRFNNKFPYLNYLKTFSTSCKNMVLVDYIGIF